MTGFTKGTDMKEKDTEKQLKALEEAVRQEQETGGKTAKKQMSVSLNVISLLVFFFL